MEQCRWVLERRKLLDSIAELTDQHADQLQECEELRRQLSRAEAEAAKAKRVVLKIQRENSGTARRLQSMVEGAMQPQEVTASQARRAVLHRADDDAEDAGYDGSLPDHDAAERSDSEDNGHLKVKREIDTWFQDLAKSTPSPLPTPRRDAN